MIKNSLFLWHKGYKKIRCNFFVNLEIVYLLVQRNIYALFTVII